MLFPVTREDVEQAADTRVHRLSPEVARRYGFSGETARLLTEVGIPELHRYGLRFELPGEFDPEWVNKAEELREDGWEVGPEADGWVSVGYFPTDHVVVDPRTGEVYQLAEAEPVPLRIHADLSSFLRTIVVAAETGEACAAVSRRPDEVERWNALSDQGRAAVEAVDPLPFAHEESEWVRLFDSMAAGMYW